jgi:hypothetical protein
VSEPSRRPTASAGARIGSVALRLWRTPVLNRLLNAAARHAPAAVEGWIERQRFAARLRDRRRAVPAAPYQLLLKRAIDEFIARAGETSIGDYLEFGVYNGTSLVAAYGVLKSVPHVRLFGFDSFEGLPPNAAIEDEATWEPGSWRSDLAFTEAVLAAEQVDRQRVTLIPGWFADTCNAAMRARHGMVKASVIMVDCDIYSSATQALDFCTPLIRDEALILFDDWHAGNLAAKNLGERKAFEEWLKRNGSFRARPFGSYSGRSESFIVTRHDAP